MSHSSHYLFCPRCGGKLDLKPMKPNEPDRLVCRSCSFVFYQDPKVAACTVVETEGGVVLLRRTIEPGYGMWTAPGGFVDRFETVPAAAVRETREESGLDVRIVDLLGVYSYEDAEVVVIFYHAEVVGGTLGAGDECSEAAVFPESSVPWKDIAFRSTRDALTDYFRKRSGR